MVVCGVALILTIGLTVVPNTNPILEAVSVTSIRMVRYMKNLNQSLGCSLITYAKML